MTQSIESVEISEGSKSWNRDLSSEFLGKFVSSRIARIGNLDLSIDE